MSGKVYTFYCPVCLKRFKYGAPYEPSCTGVSESWDEHEMTVMVLEEVGDQYVNPLAAKFKAAGPLILPDGFIS
jgi:hypothetical protein